MNKQLKLGKHKFFSKKNRKRKKKIPLKKKNIFYRLLRLFFKQHMNFIKAGFTLSLIVTCFISLCIVLFADTDYNRDMRKPNQDYYKNCEKNLDNSPKSCYYIHTTL